MHLSPDLNAPADLPAPPSVAAVDTSTMGAPPTGAAAAPLLRPRRDVSGKVRDVDDVGTLEHSDSVTSIYSVAGLSHGAPAATPPPHGPVVTERRRSSASLLDSLLMPLKATGETRVVGQDIVEIGDPFSFRHKYANLVAGGPARLQVVIDFDRTLTSFRHNGTYTSSCHGVVEKSRFTTPEYRQQTDALFQQYYPMEVASDLPRDEKFVRMVEWWTRAHELMVENRIQRAQIPLMVAESNMALRRGAREFLHELAAANVPVLIFSAGIADVIIEFLRQQNILLPNIHVVSNRMKFDENGVLIGFQGELIHTLNKNATTLRNSPERWAHDAVRSNVLVMGDNLGDVHMSDGLEVQERLAIGFLNDKVTENLAAYRATFDAVILNDGSMELPRQLVQHVISGGAEGCKRSEVLGAPQAVVAANTA